MTWAYLSWICCPFSRSMPDRANLYLRIDPHFTAYGHQVAAQSLATFLEQAGYIT